MNRRGKQARLLTNGIIGVSTATVLGDEYWDDVVLLLDGSGGGTATITDNSSAGNDMTNNNSYVGDLSTTGPYNSTQNVLDFDGTNADYLTIPYNSSFSFGSGSFTIEMWMKRATSGARTWLMGQCDSGANAYTWIEINADNTIEFQDVNIGTFASTGTITNDGNWHHVALVRNGSTFTWFIDGTSSGTTTSASSLNNNTTNNFSIGRLGEYSGGTNQNYNGQLADIRITKGVARYTSNFTPPTASLPTNVPIFGRRGVGTEATLRTRGYIGAAADGAIDPTDHFKALTYTGAGGTPSITGVGFQPDFVWIKNRDQTDTHVITDVVRGVGETLTSETTAVEVTDADTVTSFDADGFSLGADVKVNTPNEDYVAWCLKAGGSSDTYNIDDVGYATASAAGLDVGSITPTGASVNTEAGFSIVTYTGTGANATIAHGLNSAPEFVMCKTLDFVNQWHCGHTALGWSSHIHLDLTNAATGTSTAWNNTAPSSSVVNLGTSAGSNYSGPMLAYCFHSVPGVSKVGSYTGNNSSTGPHVSCGFQPAFVMVKAINSSSNWIIIDNARSPSNTRKKLLYPHLSLEEGDGITDRNPDVGMDFDSDGFTPLWTNQDINWAESYIYLAFAESNTLSDPNVGMLTLYDRYVYNLS